MKIRCLLFGHDYREMCRHAADDYEIDHFVRIYYMCLTCNKTMSKWHNHYDKDQMRPLKDRNEFK